MAQPLRFGFPVFDILTIPNTFGSNRIDQSTFEKREAIMLWTILIILLVLWALGFALGGAAVGNLVHLLLVAAVIVLVVQLVTGRRAA